MERAQAKALGLKRYENGKPCPKGHVGERFVSTGSCVECLRAQKWRIENPEAFRDAQRKSNKKRLEKDPETVREKKRESARKHAANAKRRFNRWYAKNAQRVIDAAKARRLANLEQSRELSKRMSAKRRARIKGVGGSFDLVDIQRLYVEQGGNCVYCNDFLSNKFEIDHRLPISLGGSNFPSNLQLLCRPCNRRKGAKHPEEFEAEIRRSA